MMQRDQSNTERIVFGPGPGLFLQTTCGTPYLAIRDVNGAPLLALGVTGAGFVVHLGDGVNVGDPLEIPQGDRNL